jgi:DNA-binding XRE family transcriptional regulator
MPHSNHPISAHAQHALAVFGRLLRTARVERNMSQAQLAERLGVSRHTVIALEKGKPKVGIGIAFEAAVLLGIPLLVNDERALTKLDATLAALATILPARAGRKPAALNDDF